MSDRARSTLFVTAIALLATTLAVLVLTSPSEADRVARIGSQIKCPVCQGESIANSPAQMARDMMGLVEERVSQGLPDEEILDELLSSYSGALLLDPPASGATLVLWITPAVVLVAGVGVIVWWRRHPGVETPSTAEEQTRSRGRTLAGALALGTVFAGVVIAAGFFLQDREGPNEGVAAVGVDDLSEVSNETMEAVIAANLENPQVNAMRLALANRYYEKGDYRSAFPHYLAVAESSRASDGEAVTALVRLGWMAWEGNGEVETALALLDQALSLDGTATAALYLKGLVLWCGAKDTESATDVFGEILSDPGLSPDSRSLVEADLASLSAGEPCN